MWILWKKLQLSLIQQSFNEKIFSGVCSDEASAMLGSQSGFQKKVQELAPQAKGTNCVSHRYALASKTLPSFLQNVLGSVIKIVNYIKSVHLNTRLFNQLYKDVNSKLEALLFYTSIRGSPEAMF